MCSQAPERFSSYSAYEKAVGFVKAARGRKMKNGATLWDKYQEWANTKVDFGMQSSQMKRKSVYKLNYIVASAASKAVLPTLQSASAKKMEGSDVGHGDVAEAFVDSDLEPRFRFPI